MFQDLKQIYGKDLWASDGDIGHVQDFYFDDKTWAVRYVVVDTGSWLAGRLVLLSPYAFGRLHQVGEFLSIELTRKQIEDSPSMDSQKSVSRQYEEEYYRYYGWPCYWEGGGLWGANAFPILEKLEESLPVRPTRASGRLPRITDTHLRSTLNVNGYRLQALDGKMGHVTKFMMDLQSWAITRLVIKTGWLPGREVEIATNKINEISYDESTVFVNLTHSHPIGGGTEEAKERAWKRIKPLHKKRCEYDLILQAEIIFHPGPDL